jgi:drug/metabolite transporter (DMT)-like permease
VRAINRTGWYVWIAALAAFAGVAVWHRATRLTLGDTAFVTGYILFALIVFLGIYSGRKKLSMVPAGRASAWLTLHLVVGLLAVAVFWLHSLGLWPLGLADQALAALFYVVCGSGAFGYGLQLWIPGRLTQGGRETIYERIPADLAELRAEIDRT